MSVALPQGSYFARTLNGLGFIDKLYNTGNCLACDVTRGTPIVVDGINPFSGVNFVLQAGGKIAGKVTTASGGVPVAGAKIRFFNGAGSFLGETFTNGVGDYTSPGFPATTATDGYYVRTMNYAGLIDEIYNNARCAPCTLADGTRVPVTANTTRTGIDFALDGGGLIAGYIKDQATQSPIPGVTVAIYLAGTGTKVATTDPTDANGFYSISLPVGSYDVEPNPVAGFRPFVPTGLRTGGAFARSTVVVETGTETTGVGFALVACPPITVTPTTLTLATFGQLYSKSLVATGGTALTRSPSPTARRRPASA